MLGNADQAAAVIGPAGAAAWAASAAGSAVALVLTRWWGVARSAVLLRLVQGATVVTMGLVGGVVGLLTAFFACYLVHGASNALHSTLLHRQVGAEHRATVVSINSMVSQPAASIGVLVLTADRRRQRRHRLVVRRRRPGDRRRGTAVPAGHAGRARRGRSEGSPEAPDPV